MEILSDDDQVKYGGAALTAYAIMQLEEVVDYEREELRKALLRYCELHTALLYSNHHAAEECGYELAQVQVGACVREGAER